MKFSSVHFIGIGGAGMAPLAAILLERGVAVSGSDRELNAKTARLATAGAKIFAGHDATHLPDSAELVVYSSAVPPENPERRRAVERGIPQLRRGELLAELAGEYRRVVAISGSHGKTSITAMLVHALRGCGFTPGFLIGAALRNGPSASAGRGGDLFVTEVDESDGTHTLVAPFLGIVPNLDDDHAWSVGGEEALHENFRTFARRSRKLLYYGAPLPDRLFGFHPDAIRLERRDDPCGPWTGFQAWNARWRISPAWRAASRSASTRRSWSLLKITPTTRQSWPARSRLCAGAGRTGNFSWCFNHTATPGWPATWMNLPPNWPTWIRPS